MQRWNRKTAAVKKAARSNARAAFSYRSPVPYQLIRRLRGLGRKQMRPLVRQPFRARTTEELMALLSAVATAILAVIIISMLYFGRDIFVPVALAILLSFVLAPLVGILQRIHVPRGLAVVSVVILAFSLIFAMGSLPRHATDATRGRPPALPIDDKRKDPVLSGHKSRQGHAGTRLRHAEGSQQRT